PENLRHDFRVEVLHFEFVFAIEASKLVEEAHRRSQRYNYFVAFAQANYPTLIPSSFLASAGSSFSIPRFNFSSSFSTWSVIPKSLFGRHNSFSSFGCSFSSDSS